MTNGVSFEELEYVSGTTSNIQEQINSKQNTLVQGSNITINNDTISAANGSDTVLAPGFMAPFPDNDAPTGWLLCDGSEISRSDYSALFASIGTTYGAGDGNSTFNLPSFEGDINVYILYEKNYYSSATFLSKISKNRLAYTNIEIPIVNNGILTISQNNTVLNTFSANSDSNVTIDITVPTDTSELTNSAKYITQSALNDYTTITYVENALENKQNTISDLSLIREGAELGSTALQNIFSSDVINALGYTPYNSNNPAGYTTNIGTVTSINNINPNNNGNVTLNIPTVNDATLTIQKNGITINTFTANATNDIVANIIVPTDTSDLTNNAKFITLNDLNEYQTINNLVTSISNLSTDSQYPSAKCIYDILGNIDIQLNHIISQNNEVQNENN